MVALNFNPGQHEPTIGGQVYPEGWYNAFVQASDMKKVKDERSSNQYLELTFFLREMGNTFIHRFNIIHDKPTVVAGAYAELSLLCHVMGVTNQWNDTQQLHNMPFQVYLAVEESKDDSGKTRTQNRVRNYRHPDGREFVKGNGGAPPPNPAQQNPSQAQHYQAQQPQPQPNFAPPQQQPQPSFAPQPQPGQGFAPPQGGAPQGGFAPPQGGFAPPPAGPGGFAPPPQGGAGFPPPGGGQPQQQGGFQPSGGFGAPSQQQGPGAAPQQGYPPQPGQGFAAPGFPQPQG